MIQKIKHLYCEATKTGKRRGVSIAIVVILLITIFNQGGVADIAQLEDQQRGVILANVTDLTQSTTPLPVVGTVQSESEAILRAGKSGEITGLYRSRGTTISAGMIIGEIDNAEERAEVTRAQGVVASREASLDKITSGARGEELSILGIDRTKAEREFAEARIDSFNKARSAYIVADNAIRNNTDALIQNPYGDNPILIFNTINSQLKVTIQNNRVTLERNLTDWNTRIESFNTDTDIEELVTTTERYLNDTISYLNSLALAVNSIIQSVNESDADVAAWKAAVSTARTNVNAAITTLSASKDTYTQKAANVQIAEEQLTIGQDGGRSEDVRDAEAALLQAESALRAAQARLERTILRSPISGTLNFLPIERGDFVSTGETLAIVSNNNTLEILAYVTDEDAVRLDVGNTVAIGAKALGTISYIAPAIDPNTKKIELRIAIAETFSKLFNGETINLAIERTPRNTGTITDYIIPLSALKVSFENTVVFTVSEDSTLVAHEVTIGSLLGDSVIIESGITGDMDIVLDARGLKEGQTVIVN